MLGLQVLDMCMTFVMGAGIQTQVLGLCNKVFIHCTISPEPSCSFWLHTQTYLMFPTSDVMEGFVLQTSIVCIGPHPDVDVEK